MNTYKTITIGVFAVFLITATANAQKTVVLSNTDVRQMNGIQVTATYDDIAGTLSVQYVNGSSPVTNRVLGIDKIYYNLPNKVSGCPRVWMCNFGPMDTHKFGSFLSRDNMRGSSMDGIKSPIILPLSGKFPAPPPDNSQGANTAVRIRLKEGCFVWVSNGKLVGPQVNSPACVFKAKQNIPEFPTIALPIAGVIAIMFARQNRRR